jgi:hypothetical protein
MAFAVTVTAADHRALLWADPGALESLDFAGGPGGQSKAPQAPFTFQKEDPQGSAPKVTVRDGRGAVWSVKFGPEVKAENFATRFAWAAGYFAEPTYFVREGNIEGAGALGRTAHYIDRTDNGHFRDARFELRDQAIHFIPASKWSLDDKSLKGTKELSGLKLTLMLLSNWDVKPENTAIVEAGGQRYYAITDWGASMGLTGDISGRSKWDCEGYARQSENFVDEVADGYVTFNYAGKERDVVSHGIRVDDVKWFMSRMGKLTDRQILSALEASGATAQESACFAKALGKRLGQLVTVASGAETSGTTVIRTRTVTKTQTTTTPR